ncbi:MAG TPA: RidA family protein [Verrucomicrobiae bacterium]|nr:RidA family protein [Verrucomicrobiae bacterium]
MRYIRPSPMIPLSHAVVHGGIVYVSGQVGFRPGSAELVSAEVTGQARQAFAHIDSILGEAGTSRDRILRCGIFLKDVGRDFAAMNGCYAEWLGSHRPARTTVGADFALPGILIEVDCIAALPSSAR